mmetsp:Transcript_32030/g.63494  ORF Transcript_32030/g.63494 Transcript_32030/m.63494 type:complete len:83 (-) Transcript_32030:20-268(-)
MQYSMIFIHLKFLETAHLFMIRNERMNVGRPTESARRSERDSVLLFLLHSDMLLVGRFVRSFGGQVGMNGRIETIDRVRVCQ